MELLCLEAVTGSFLQKKLLKFLQYSHENTCVRVFKDRLCEYCETFKDSYYKKHLPTTASGLFLSMKTNLLNVHGLCGQCSRKKERKKRKICSERV